ncbi:MAG: hypothetical protein SFY32_15515 [Bacteroidota bacterium]|nr:hypothetical protein [Bacteroidota bacterium]
MIKTIEDKNTEIFKSKIIIILSKELDKNSNIINIQDYVENGKSYIPVFTSIDKFNESTKGINLGKGKIEIDGIFLLLLINGNETLRINPGLTDEQSFKASDLLVKYKTEIEELKIKMNNLKK